MRNVQRSYSNKTGNVCVNVILRCAHATTVAIEKAISITYSECVCGLSHPARNVYAPYCHLWPVWLYHIIPCYLINDTIFKKLIEPFSRPNRSGLHCHPQLFFPLQFPQLVIKWLSFPQMSSFSSPSPYFVLLSMPLTGFTHNSTHPTSPPILLVHFNSLSILLFPDII